MHKQRSNDTIAALATHPNRGGVGVIRISGSQSTSVLHKLAPRLPATLPSHKLFFTSFEDHYGHIMDQGFAVVMLAPRSYTTENVVELHVHGGSANISRVLRVIFSYGVRPAEPGEFTLRAFLAGRIDLTQAEAVMDMVTAPTEGALDQAFTQLRGGLAERVIALREAALNIQSRLEVQIDFIDEDLGDVLSERATNTLQGLISEVNDLAETWHTGAKLRQGARVVLIGPPNAGKSSLFNALLRRSRAIVTPIPGTTRDYLEELTDIHGLPVLLTDTAGLRKETEDAVELAGIERTGKLASEADLILVLTPYGAQESAIPDDISADKVLRIRTKADLGEGDVSAVTGDGIESLFTRIKDRLLPSKDVKSTHVLVTHERHYQALKACEQALAHAYEASATGEPADVVVVDVQEAVHQLGLIVGATSTEDLLDRIFGEFCIGK